MSKTLLEVIALDPSDARAAVAAGADRLELVSSMEFSGFNPPVARFAAIRAAVDVPLRVMIRLRDGFQAGGPAALDVLTDSVRELREAGADEFVLGWLDEDGAVDQVAVGAVVESLGGAAWTFHKAIDAAADRDAVFAAIRGLPGLDTVLTSGGPFPAAKGTEVLAAEAAREAALGPAGLRLLVGGGLKLADVPALRAGGLREFHIGTAARTGGTWVGPIDPDLVAGWRGALDA
ncbi:MAG TPA: copper homeostasis protein CutC [Actinocrinis sp.]|nr:copper homeostasis protein CutC [Actinocrinis sp.]